MKHKNIFIHAAMWFATSAAVIAGIIVTQEVYALLAFIAPLFGSIAIECF